MTAGDIAERTLPHSLEAEKALLGAILLHPESLADIAGQITPDDFFRTGHGDLFRVFQTLESQDRPIEFVTVSEVLKTSGRMESAGGPAYIASLVDGLPKSTNVEHYADIVREKSRLRQAITAANRILAEAYSEERDAKAIIESSERALFDLTVGRTQGGFRRLSEIMPAVLEQIDQARSEPGKILGVRTGLTDLDDMLRGLQPAKLYIFAARPGMGKSSLAENIARSAAQDGKVCGVVSLEMADEEYAFRALSGQARIDGQRLQRGFLGERDFDRLAQAFGDLSALPIYIADDPFVTLAQVRSMARRLKARDGLDLLVLDYTQLMCSEGKSENRAIEVGNITRGLKGLSKELAIPVVALAQLNRQLENRDDKRPRLSDLRDSGRIEEDADVVLFIYRDDHYNPDTERKGIAELIIAKHRGGELGMVEVRWVKEETRFENLERHQPEAEDRMLPMGDRA